jgi:hypothetical protein
MNTTLLMNIAGLLLAGAVLIYAEPALARMGKATHWAIRYAMLMLAGGALGVVLTIANGGTIDLATLLVLAGIALLMLFERRLRAAYPLRQRGHRHA